MSARTIKDAGTRAAGDWLRPLARVGYGARGLIYLIVGFYAALAAVGGGESMGSEDALRRLLSTGYGTTTAYLLLVGLLGYALWRLFQAGFDTDDHRLGLKGLAVRGGLLASAATYLTLAFYVFSRTRGASGGSSGGAADAIAGFVGAQWVAICLALALTGVAIAHFLKAAREKYADHIQADAATMRFIHPVAKTGLVARGLVFLVLSFLAGLRAWRGGGGADQLGSKEALDFIQSLPGGGLLLAATGAGLLAFSFYSFILAAYRRINVEDA